MRKFDPDYLAYSTEPQQTTHGHILILSSIRANTVIIDFAPIGAADKLVREQHRATLLSFYASDSGGYREFIAALKAHRQFGKCYEASPRFWQAIEKLIVRPEAEEEINYEA